MKLLGANSSAKISGAEQLPGTADYFIGNDPEQWHTGVATYRKVNYEGLYPGIDAVFYGDQRELEYNFTVAPGVDPKRIVMEFSGARPIGTRDGDIVLELNGNSIKLHKPVVYQLAGSTRRTVDGVYAITGNRVRFQIGEYDRSQLSLQSRRRHRSQHNFFLSAAEARGLADGTTAQEAANSPYPLKDLVLQLRYLGMLPQIGHREYRFQIEAQDKSIRTVALTIDDGMFRKNQLMFQEAPDLCYQKMLADVTNEAMGTHICSLAPVTESEIASYRDSHPTGKPRKTAARARV